MKHQSLDQLATVADVAAEQPGMSREERLERWAQCLDAAPKRRLRSLDGIEYGPKARRREVRENDSPLSVAYADPMLRREGLRGDTLGDALDFFEISFGDAHRVLCSCMHGRTMLAGEVAERVRGLTAPRLSAIRWLWAVAGVGAALPFAAQLLR
jgi:hypothetical protein